MESRLPEISLIGLTKSWSWKKNTDRILPPIIRLYYQRSTFSGFKMHIRERIPNSSASLSEGLEISSGRAIHRVLSIESLISNSTRMGFIHARRLVQSESRNALSFGTSGIAPRLRRSNPDDTVVRTYTELPFH
jgi:hypothetical protein